VGENGTAHTSPARAAEAEKTAGKHYLKRHRHHLQVKKKFRKGQKITSKLPDPTKGNQEGRALVEIIGGPKKIH